MAQKPTVAPAWKDCLIPGLSQVYNPFNVTSTQLKQEIKTRSKHANNNWSFIREKKAHKYTIYTI